MYCGGATTHNFGLFLSFSPCLGGGEDGHSKDFRRAGVERPSNVIHDFSAMHISSWCSTTPIPVPSPPHSLCLGRVVGGSGPVPLFPPTPAPHLPPGGSAVVHGWKAPFCFAAPKISGHFVSLYASYFLGRLPRSLPSLGFTPLLPGNNILTCIQLIHVSAPLKLTIQIKWVAVLV